MPRSKRRWLRALAFVATAAIATTTGLLVANPAFADSSQQCKKDGGLVVQVCITQNYSEVYRGDARYVRVLNYTVSAKKLLSGVVITKFTTLQGATGTCYNTCGTVSQTHTDSVTTSATGPYKAVPPWSQYYTRVDDNGHQPWFQCGTVTLSYKYRAQARSVKAKVCQGKNG